MGDNDYPLAEVVTGVAVARDFVLDVTFADGATREVDLSNDLSGPIFEPLKSPEYFRLAKFDEEAGTVVWPNGADLAPEFLRYGDDRPDCFCSNNEAARGHSTSAS